MPGAAPAVPNPNGCGERWGPRGPPCQPSRGSQSLCALSQAQPRAEAGGLCPRKAPGRGALLGATGDAGSSPLTPEPAMAGKLQTRNFHPFPAGKDPEAPVLPRGANEGPSQPPKPAQPVAISRSLPDRPGRARFSGEARPAGSWISFPSRPPFPRCPQTSAACPPSSSSRPPTRRWSWRWGRG